MVQRQGKWSREYHPLPNCILMTHKGHEEQYPDTNKIWVLEEAWIIANYLLGTWNYMVSLIHAKHGWLEQRLTVFTSVYWALWKKGASVLPLPSIALMAQIWAILATSQLASLQNDLHVALSNSAKKKKVPTTESKCHSPFKRGGRIRTYTSSFDAIVSPPILTLTKLQAFTNSIDYWMVGLLIHQLPIQPNTKLYFHISCPPNIICRQCQETEMPIATYVFSGRKS
jgi:hypothetical protein